MTTLSDAQVHLSAQLCRILEETAFMLVDSTDAPLPEPALAIEASLAFSGKHSGTCWLVVTEQDAGQLATEMLGSDETAEGESSVCDQAVSELLNILTAWFLEDWWGDNVDHSLGLPKSQRLPLTETRVFSAAPEARVIISTDSGCTFLACVTLE